MPTTNFKTEISFTGANILVLEIDESADELLTKFDQIEFYSDEYNKISSEKRKREFLGVRLALKELLGTNVMVSYDSNGKPCLQDNSYHISISHSGNWIAVIAHPTRVVGIDIECPSDKIQKLYTRFLSEKEQEDLSQGKNLKQLQLAWSVKEALYKIIGKEAVDFAKQLQIFPFEVKTEGEINAKHVLTEKHYKLSYYQTDAYTLVYCLV
ncbi:MAG: 4'-phosphopantetheinyl transferase superfamily protein [Paludibacter sp.]|nr:4'-phosphopantetheinyl transferase superfamily protein [Paludibacter sp.]